MEPEVKKFWELIRVEPAKWSGGPYGDLGGGFWVVGVLGNHVVWYNDIEEGFNTSTYSTYGVIQELNCNQDELDMHLRGLLHYGLNLNS